MPVTSARPSKHQKPAKEYHGRYGDESDPRRDVTWVLRVLGRLCGRKGNFAPSAFF